MKTMFKLKVLTPLFMGGADPRGKPELRAASIRGAMRFWFRAMAGAITDDPAEIYKLESEVFGNTEKKSRVVVRVKTANVYLIKKGERVKKVKIETQIERGDRLNFLAYLANMGLAEYKQSKGFIWSRFAFKPSTNFEVEIYSNSNEIKEIASLIFQVAVTLGGFGARWRHGFGSCEIQSGPRISWQNALENVKKWVANQIAAVKKLPEIKENELVEFPSFRNGNYSIWENRLKGNFNDWQEILTFIGLNYREFRIKEGGYTGFGHTRDYVTLINSDGFSKEDLLNDVFGLPIQFGKNNIVNISDIKKPAIGRRASPLILHVEPRQKVLRATVFKSRIVPNWDSTRYYAKFGRKIDLTPPTIDDFHRVEQFLESLGLKRRYPNAQQ